MTNVAPLLESEDSNIIILYNLEAEFDQMLIQYKQASLNYINLLNHSTPTETVYNLLALDDNVRTYCSGTKTGLTQTTMLKTNTECAALCSTNKNCGGYDLSSRSDLSKQNTDKKFTCNLYKSGVSALPGTMINTGCYKQVLTTESDLQTTINYLATLNKQLIIVNGKIVDKLNSMKSNIDDINSENKKKLEKTKKITNKLQLEKDNIVVMQNQYQTVNAENKFQSTNFQQSYARFLFWLILFLIILFLTIKMIFFPNLAENTNKTILVNLYDVCIFTNWIFVNMYYSCIYGS